MTGVERDMWRGAFDLYDWNHQMPNSQEAWTGFIRSATDFANRFDWKSCPLAYRLMEAVLFAVEDEVKLRQQAEAAQPVQLSLF